MKTEFKRGEILIITEGIYSDYRVIKAFKCIKDFSIDKYRNTTNRKVGVQDVIKDLLDNQYVEPVVIYDLWMGNVWLSVSKIER